MPTEPETVAVTQPVIPTSFMLGAHIHRVRTDADLYQADGKREIGQFDQTRQAILIQPPCRAYDPTPSTIVGVYYHELAHAIIRHMDREELDKDERLVEALGRALHQIDATKAGALEV